MSSKVRRKTRESIDLDDSVWNLKTVVVLLLILGCLSLFIFGISKLKRSQVASIPAEFEGRIVEKQMAFNETDQGSYPYFRLVVEVDGSRFTVPVYKEIYGEAKVGMRLKRSVKGLEVMDPPKGNK